MGNYIAYLEFARCFGELKSMQKADIFVQQRVKDVKRVFFFCFVPQGSVLVRTGCVTEISTARTNRMRRAVKCPSVNLLNSPVPMTLQCVSLLSASVMAGGTVPTTRMKDPTVVRHKQTAFLFCTFLFIVQGC